MSDKKPDAQPPAEAEPDSCGPGSDCGCGPDPSGNLARRDFIRLAGLTTAVAAAGAACAPDAPGTAPTPAAAPISESEQAALDDPDWPVLKVYGPEFIDRIALPLGGIGTGTVSLTGFGSLRDWELMNRPAKGFTPNAGSPPFFAIYIEDGETRHCRLAEGPLPLDEYEASHGAAAPNARLPRFSRCSFAGGYPFGRVMLSDDELPLEVHLKAFNPMVPADADASGIPVAALTYELRNTTDRPLRASVAGSLPNFIGMDGWETTRDWKGDRIPAGADGNTNRFREGNGVRGLYMESSGVAPDAPAAGTLALTTTSDGDVSHRTDWIAMHWGNSILDFWDDFSADGRLDERDASGSATPMASLCVEVDVPAGCTVEVPFLLTWHFPNRYSWTRPEEEWTEDDRIGNYYAEQYTDAWEVAERTALALPRLQARTVSFLRAFLGSDLPDEVKEAALFNASTLRTQTCFRMPDGRFFGWEGNAPNKGCCHGSCTHVWNYEHTTAFLYGRLALTMREVEFGHATDDDGLMSFRIGVPLDRAQEWGLAAVDGQMGCIMKMYRDWQLSGDEATLRTLWPKVRAALEFAWIPGGWDADKDGVMEGAQHNTMDVEYYGPNPEMGFWYLGALRASEEMARAVGDEAFADECRDLFDHGSAWVDANLFDGEYYIHEIQPPSDPSAIAPSLLIGMGSEDLSNPDFQLGPGCLVDQLVGQLMAHTCGLGYLAARENVASALESIWRYNRRENLQSHFNSMRTYALAGESVVLIASYPKGRPDKPFSYFTEAWTGLEYTAAAGMFYEGMTDEGLATYRLVRERHDGRKRNPYDEPECGHHYARAMAAWGAVLALSGFQYSAVTKSMTVTSAPGRYFWSNGYAWGSCEVGAGGGVSLTVVEGALPLERFALVDGSAATFEAGHTLSAGTTEQIQVEGAPA